MITQNTLPKNYNPYQNLSVCSNLLIGGGHLVVLGEVLPLLVGQGEIPKIWMQAPTDKTGKKYVSLVVASVASHPAVNVVSNNAGLTVSVGGTPVLHVVQESQDSATIDLLDLRPIGLDIFGTKDSLHAGSSNFSHNTFMGVGALLAFEGQL